MKKIFTTLLVLSAAIIALAVTHLWVYQSDGTYTGFDVTTVDSVSLVPPAVTAVSPQFKKFTSEGGQFTITLQSNKAWTATVSDPDKLTLSKASGTGNSLIACTVAPNVDSTPYRGVVTFEFEGGSVINLPVTVDAANPFMACLDGSEYIVFQLGPTAFQTISNRVALDLRPNDEYVFLYDWAGSGYVYPSAPDAFFGDTDWVSMDGTYTIWCGAGLFIATESSQEAAALLDRYNRLVRGHESEWEFVTVVRNSSDGWIQLFGFGESAVNFTFSDSGDDIAMNIPADGQWHQYSINCAELGATFDLEASSQGVNAFAFGSSSNSLVEVCAAFLMKKNTSGERLWVNPAVQTVGAAGGTLTAEVTSNTSWTASSNKSWLKLTSVSGTGSGSIAMTASPNLGMWPDTAVVTVTTNSGNTSNTLKVVRQGNPSGCLLGSEFIVYEMSTATFDEIADRVVLDLRPNDEYLKIWDWNPSALRMGGAPDFFYGGTDWYSLQVTDNQGWGGAGNAIYAGENGQYATQANAVLSSYESAVKGHESEWDLVLVMRYPEQESVPYVELYGFTEDTHVFWAADPSSSGNGIDHVMDLPNDGGWHVYSINCAELGGFNLSLNNGAVNVIARGAGVGVCDVCAAFLVKRGDISNGLMLSPGSKTVEGQGGSFDVTIGTSSSWSASSNQSWLSLSSTSGSGSSVIQATVAPNAGMDADEAVITVTADNGVVKTARVTRLGNFMSALNGSEYIVFEMSTKTFREIANQVTLDLRPNDEYLKIWDWNPSALQVANIADPFTGGKDWFSLNVGYNLGWGAAGNAIYAGENGQYATQANAVLSSYESAVKGHESEWDLVLVMRYPEQESVPYVELYGFTEDTHVFWAADPSSSGNGIDHVMDLPNDGGWHVYSINCAELGGFNLSLNNGAVNVIARGAGAGVCDVCAAFLVKR